MLASVRERKGETALLFHRLGLYLQQFKPLYQTMTDQHPITPPPELVREWCAHSNKHETYDQFWCHIATQAARWGADQELEACVKWIEDCGYHPSVPEDVRAARRPQPPSLKEQALRILGENGTTLDGRIELEPEDIPIIRRALEALPNE